MRTVNNRLKAGDFRTIRVRPKQADAELKTGAHQAWREEVLRRADYRCQWPEGCSVRGAPGSGIRMFADHVVERRDGGAAIDVRNGQCLCGRHHTLKTLQARAERAGA